MDEWGGADADAYWFDRYMYTYTIWKHFKFITLKRNEGTQKQESRLKPERF